MDTYLIPTNIKLSINSLLDYDKKLNTVPIWTNKNDEYYKFEISAARIPNETKNLDVFCHICNVDVPSEYLSEHNNSLLHTTHTKIIDIALERVRQQLNQPKIEAKKGHAYFCDVCTTRIDLKDKNLHDTSKPHKDAYIRGRILKEFLNFYSGENIEMDKIVEAVTELDEFVNTDNDLETKETTINKCMSETNETNIEKDENKENIQSYAQITKELKLKEPKPNEPKLKEPKPNEPKLKEPKPNEPKLKEPKPNEPKPNEPEPNEKKIVEVNKINAHTFIEKANKIANCNLKNVKAIDEDTVEVQAENGSRFRVKLNDYHGYNQLENSLQCKLCRKLLPGRGIDHEYDPGHLQKLALPVLDKHGIRQIDNVWSHCMFCNTIIENKKMHLLSSDKHNDKVDSALISDKNTDEKPQVVNKKDMANKTYCAPCDVYVDTNNYDSHKAGKKHRSNIKEDASGSIEYYHWILQAIGKKELQCIVCRTKIPAKIIDADEHLKSATHTDNYNALLASHTIVKSKNMYFCNTCTCNVACRAEFDHIYGRRHKFNMNHKIVNQPQNTIETKIDFMRNTNNEKELFCYICEAKVPNNPKCTKEHLDGYNHKENYKSILTANKLKLVGDKIVCELCDVILTENTRIKHVNIATHKQKLHDFNKSPVKEQNVTQSNLQVEEVLHYQLSKSGTQLQCKICHVTVPNSEFNINQHVNGTSHKSQYNIFFQTNNYSLLNDKIKCNTCQILLEKYTEIKHANSVAHKQELQAVKLCENTNKSMITVKENTAVTNYQLSKISDVLTFCYICKISIPNTQNYSKIHLDSSNHKKKYDDFIQTNKYSLLNNKIKCNICQIFLEKDQVIKHSRHITHIQKLQAFKLTENTEKAVKESTDFSHYHISKLPNSNLVHCKICEIDFVNDETNANLHIESDSHKEEYDNFFQTNKYVIMSNRICCNVCKIYLLNDNEIEHANTGEHQQKLLNEVIGETDSLHIIKAFDSKSLVCNLCRLKIHNNPTSIKNHTLNKPHITNYAKLLKDNRIRKINGQYKCYICQVYFDKASIHIKTDLHEQNVGEESSDSDGCEPHPLPPLPGLCLICNITYLNREYHDRSLDHINRLDNFISQHKIFRGDNSLTYLVCTVCDEICFNVDSMVLHVSTEKHLKYKAEKDASCSIV